MAPNCANASNPYHECTQACLQPKTKSLPNKNKTSSSGYGPSVPGGELGKKVDNEERQGKQGGCPKASNPYHNCDDNCNYKRLSASSSGGIIPPPPPPLKYESKRHKKAAASDKAEKVVVEPAADAVDTSDHIPLEPHSGEREIQPAPVKEQLNNEEDKVAAGGSAEDSSFSGFPHHESCCSNEQDSDSLSSSSSSRVAAVGGYNVKESFAAILRSILHKHGDIGASCQLESLVMRSYYMECVCFVVQQLQQSSTDLEHLTSSKLKELSAVLTDVESAQLRVAWLRSVLDEIAHNIEVESLREELHSRLQTLSHKEQEVADIKTRIIPEIRDRLTQLGLKSSEIDNRKHAIDQVHG